MTTHQLAIPALLSDDPLGFLAALGVLELATTSLDGPVALSWEGLGAPAVLHTPAPLGLDDLAALLARHLPAKEAADPLPLAPGILTIAKVEDAPKNDPLRMPIDTAHHIMGELAQAERNRDDPCARWFGALVNQTCYEDISPTKKPGATTPVRCSRVTPLFAPSGQMTLRQTWIAAVAACHKDPGQFRSALTGWVRVPGYAGANLDHRALGDAHLNSEGKAAQQGAPGPTWLALHGLATFRLTAANQRQAATAWDTRTRPPAMRWPIWTLPLSRTAVTALLEHPAVHADRPTPRTLTNLGITAICAAPRKSLSQSDGPFTAAHVLWP